MKNIYKSTISKPTKHNKNVDILLFLLWFIESQRKKIFKKHSLWVQALEKGETQWVLGLLYHNMYQIQKNKFPVKFIYIYIKYICLTFNWQKKLKWFQKVFRGHPFMTSTKNDQFFDPPTLSAKMNNRSIV